MIKFLKTIVLWLEKRFPEKVEITVSEYNSLFKTLSDYNQYLQGLNTKIEALEAKLQAPVDNGIAELKADVEKVKSEVSKLHVVLGFSRGQAPLER